jgi:putative hydroxymethylpyrimidine transport system substrate-binding protein
VIPLDRAGVPTYDELVLVASSDRLRSSHSYEQRVQKFVDAFLQGTEEARSHPNRALAILGKVTASKHSFLAASTPATLALLGNGCLSQSEWQRFGAWMHERGLLKSPVEARDVMTTRFLGSHCKK